MANKRNYWWLKMRINEEFPILYFASRALYDFLFKYPTTSAYLLFNSINGRFTVVDKASFFEERGRMTFSARTIIFYGNLGYLTQLAAAVPPSLDLSFPSHEHEPNSQPQED